MPRTHDFSSLLASDAAIPATDRTEAAEAIAVIAAVPAGGIIATDCDNTVWAGDVGDEIVRIAEAHPRLFGDRKVDFLDYALRLESDYEGACLASAALGLTPAAPEVRTALATRLRDHLRPRVWLVEALQSAVERGVRVIAVSASGRLAVEVGLDQVGLTGQCDVIAVDPTPEGFLAPWPIGHGKPASLRATGLSGVDVAIGDSRWDGPLLDFGRRGLLLVPAADDPSVMRSVAEVLNADAQSVQSSGQSSGQPQ